MNYVVRAFDAKIEDVNMQKRSVVARINTASRDRYNTIILPRGCQSKQWRASGGPVLWEHGKDVRRFTDPIANSRDLWNNGGSSPTELVAEPVFLNDDFSQQRLEWYRDGKVRGWSVNVLPARGTFGPPTKEELRGHPDWEGVDTIYREWELAEFSGTTIPGNAEALTAKDASAVLELVNRGLWLPDEARTAYEAAASKPDAVVPAIDQPELGSRDSKESRSLPYAEQDGDHWIVRRADGPDLALPSEALAKECVAAMGGQPPAIPPAVAILAEARAASAQVHADLEAFFDLWRHGRV